MATNTTRLGLIKPDLTDNVDIGDINANMDDIDIAVGSLVVTSTTRPAVPFVGQLIYETDTSLSFVWDGSTWQSAGGKGGAEISATAPSNPQPGDLWLDTTSALMYVYYDDGSSAQWVAAVGGTVPQQGKILQVVSTTKTDTFSASVASGAISGDVTGLTVSITPTSATSKLLVFASLTGSSSDTSDIQFAIYRDSALSTFVGNSAGSRKRMAGASFSELAALSVMSGHFSFLDDASSTSSTTYSVRLGHPGTSTNTVYLNRGKTDTDSSRTIRGASSITVMEVAV
jgi:hypothetical protein